MRADSDERSVFGVLGEFAAAAILIDSEEIDVEGEAGDAPDVGEPLEVEYTCEGDDRVGVLVATIGR